MATYRVTWTIDAEADSMAEAAQDVWRDIFGRDTATNEDACVFEVEGEDGERAIIDLAGMGE